MKDGIHMILFFVMLALIAMTGHERWKAIQNQQDWQNDPAQLIQPVGR